MWLIWWIPSVSAVLAHKYQTTVASGNMQEAKAVVENTREKIRSMQYAWDVNPWTVWEFYTQKWHMPSVNEKIGSILNVKA